MKRCLELAKNGLGSTYPNPMVGSVIVYKDQIIGEGWHQKAGGPHAEVNALHTVKDKSLLQDSTIYVSLEPCSHFGKTPPCCDLIIKYKIPNVVIGTTDPNILVAGSGIKKLIEAGHHISVGVLEAECLELNKRFFCFHQKKRPFIILKWAQTADGFIAPLEKTEQKPFWISNPYSRQLVHKWRTEEQAILVGTQTAIDDNPKLNARDWKGKDPIRIVLDPKQRIPMENAVFDNEVKTIVISSFKNRDSQENTTFERIDFSQHIASQIADILYKEQVQSVIIEGGRQTLQTFIDANLWDEARVFKGTNCLEKGIQAPVLLKTKTAAFKIEHDELIIFRNYD